MLYYSRVIIATTLAAGCSYRLLYMEFWMHLSLNTIPLETCEKTKSEYYLNAKLAISNCSAQKDL